MGSCDPNHASFSHTYSALMSGLSLGARLLNIKFVPLAILELVAVNLQKFSGSRDPCHAHFSDTFVRSHVGTNPGNTPAEFEVLIRRFGAISI